MTTTKRCADCGLHEGTLEIRKRFLCRDCFIRYVASKTLKRVGTYQLQTLAGDRRPKLLLPLSGGPSSLALLHALDAQLQRQQEKRNGTVYDLILLHVDSSPSPDQHRIEQWRSNVAARFPSHQFLPLVRLHQIFSSDPKIEADMQLLSIYRQSNETDENLMLRLFQRVKTPTARADLSEILLQRLIVALARAENCDSIVWGHSDSRLAALALAAVAKGRGAAVPSAIADGPSPHGVVFHHPVRDLFRTELELYLKVAMEDSESLLVAEHDDSPPVSIRHTSIDDLLGTYITSQGVKYPGIMANVVRTAEKLQIPASTTPECPLCSMPMKSTATTMCYGCERMRQDIMPG